MKISTALEKVYGMAFHRQQVRVGYVFEKQVKNMLDELALRIGHADTKIVQAAILMLHMMVQNDTPIQEIPEEKKPKKSVQFFGDMMLSENAFQRHGYDSEKEMEDALGPIETRNAIIYDIRKFGLIPSDMHKHWIDEANAD